MSELTQDLESTKKLLENNSQQLSKISHHSRFVQIYSLIKINNFKDKQYS